MSSFYDDENEQYDEDNYDEEEYEPSDEDLDELGEEQPELVAPTIYPGKEDQRTWGSASQFGIESTTAEGEFGRKLRRVGRSARSPEEIFRDDIRRAASSENLALDRATVNAVLSRMSIIPDLSYKSASGVLLGWLFCPYLGKRLSKAEKIKADAILAKTGGIKDKFLQIDPLNVVAYARAWNMWLNRAGIKACNQAPSGPKRKATVA